MLNYYRRLRDLREDHDLTQREVAEMLGIRQPQYARYEKGCRDLPTDLLIRLARFYRVPADYILNLTDVKIPYE